jgi:hypothetical protein
MTTKDLPTDEQGWQVLHQQYHQFWIAMSASFQQHHGHELPIRDLAAFKKWFPTLTSDVRTTYMADYRKGYAVVVGEGDERTEGHAADVIQRRQQGDGRVPS